MLKLFISKVFILAIYLYDRATIKGSNHIILTDFADNLDILKIFQGVC